MSSVILRLRHLRAVYGRNFSVSDEESSENVGVTFALSSVNQDNIGYYYVSDVACDLKNPEWDPVEIHNLPKQYLSSKAVLFTFFLSHRESNSILFEIVVHFSGLVPTNSEIRENMCVSDSTDQIYFQMGRRIYAFRENFDPGIICPQLWPKGKSLPASKLSYDLTTLQRFLANKEASKVQLERIRYMQNLASGLQSSLCNLFSQGVATERLAIAIDSVKQRTETLKYSISLARNKLHALESRKVSLEQEFLNINENKAAINSRLKVLKQSLKDGYNDLSKTRYALLTRILHLLNEVYGLFTSDLINPMYNIGEEMNSNGIINSVTAKNDKFMDKFSNDYVHMNGHFSVPLDGIELSNDNSNNNPIHRINYGIETFTSPTCFAYIVHLFTLITAILDQPIIYPRDFVEIYPKLKLLDISTRDISQSDRCQAICILKRNIMSLGSRFNLYLTPEKHALYNLKYLFDHFQNNLLTKIYQHDIVGFV
ncbi:unnamed protein product [Schistosoma margrebowiei]|uniref:UV radiation resistance-associated gene protein n=1 Tax=Schistosoma margrebowiei TaxID=48269 RepID=A0AA84Z636_9TREM|nr:unnamed protein product [Schistosoma margrebowiei]